MRNRYIIWLWLDRWSNWWLWPLWPSLCNLLSKKHRSGTDKARSLHSGYLGEIRTELSNDGNRDRICESMSISHYNTERNSVCGPELQVRWSIVILDVEEFRAVCDRYTSRLRKHRCLVREWSRADWGWSWSLHIGRKLRHNIWQLIHYTRCPNLNQRWYL